MERQFDRGPFLSYSLYVIAAMSYHYTRQSPYLGACVFFVSKKKFVDMPVLHGMACNLEADDQRKRAGKDGLPLLKQWEETYRSDYADMTREINVALWSAFWTMAVVIALSTSVAAHLGGKRGRTSFISALCDEPRGSVAHRVRPIPL